MVRDDGDLALPPVVAAAVAAAAVVVAEQQQQLQRLVLEPGLELVAVVVVVAAELKPVVEPPVVEPPAAEPPVVELVEPVPVGLDGPVAFVVPKAAAAAAVTADVVAPPWPSVVVGQ